MRSALNASAAIFFKSMGSSPCGNRKRAFRSMDSITLFCQCTQGVCVNKMPATPRGVWPAAEACYGNSRMCDSFVFCLGGLRRFDLCSVGGGVR